MTGSRLVLPLAAAGLLLLACAGSDGPRDVARAFWDAVREGDVETARALVRDDQASLLNSDRSEQTGEIELGEATVDGDRASVATTMIAREEGAERAIEMKTILVRQEGAWRVDMMKTMMSMAGGAMGLMFEELGEAMQEGLEQMGESLQKSLPPSGEQTPPEEN